MSKYFDYTNRFDENLKFIEVNLSEKFEEIEIYPLSDLHFGKKESDRVLFTRFVNFIKEKENRFLVLNGDLMENSIKDSVSFDYDYTMTPMEELKQICTELKPIKDRIIGVVSGNHDARTAKGTDIDVMEFICEKLECSDKYSEAELYIKVTFGLRSQSPKRQCYTIYMTHGAGGGKRPGSSLNNAELVAMSTEADIYIFGHTHKKIAYKNLYRKVDLRNNKITNSERLFVYSSHWMMYLPKYCAKKMLPPSAKGCTTILLQASNKNALALV